jgi:hypothetical protein
MTIRLKATAIAIGCLMAGTTAARAQTDHSHLGLHLLYNTTYDEAGMGVQFSAPMARHLEFYPSADIYFQSPGTRWQLNADVKYRAFGEKLDWLYLGTGLNLAFFNVDGASAVTRAGWNLIMGAESLRGQVHPFAEARATVQDQTRFQIAAGVNVTLGKH